MQNKEGFECKNAANCGTEQHHLLSPTIASGVLVDPNPVVQLQLRGSFLWLRFSYLLPMSSIGHSNHPPAITFHVEWRTTKQALSGDAQNLSQSY